MKLFAVKFVGWMYAGGGGRLKIALVSRLGYMQCFCALVNTVVSAPHHMMWAAHVCRSHVRQFMLYAWPLGGCNFVLQPEGVPAGLHLITLMAKTLLLVSTPASR